MIEKELDKLSAIPKKQRGKWHLVVRQELQETGEDTIIKMFPDEEGKEAYEFARDYQEQLRNAGVMSEINVDREKIPRLSRIKRKPWSTY